MADGSCAECGAGGEEGEERAGRGEGGWEGARDRLTVLSAPLKL